MSMLHINYYPCHNILKLCNILVVLVQPPFTTSKTIIDVKYMKLDMRVVEPLKT